MAIHLRASLIAASAVAALAVSGCSLMKPKERRSADAPAPMGMSAGILEGMGNAAAASGDFRGAANLYARAAEAEPRNAHLQVKLGSALHEAGDAAGAEEAFRRALALEADNILALAALGRAAIGRDDPRAAREYYGRAIAASEGPAHHRLYNGLGVALDMTGDHAGAQGAYRKGLETAPDHAALVNNLGLSLALGGRYDEAIATLQGAVSNGGAGERLRYNLALVYGLAGRADDALGLARNDEERRAIEANVEYYRWLAANLRNGAPRAETVSAPR